MKKILSMLLVLCMVFALCACGTQTAVQTEQTTATSESTTEAEVKAYTFTYIDVDGNEKSFDLTSDKETVGEALLEEGLISGEEGEYGLYVTEVDGVAVEGNTYWAFYINGEYASTGVSDTPLEDGSTYLMQVEAY